MNIKKMLFSWLLKNSTPQERASYSIDIDSYSRAMQQNYCDHDGFGDVEIVEQELNMYIDLRCKKCGLKKSFKRSDILNSDL